MAIFSLRFNFKFSDDSKIILQPLLLSSYIINGYICVKPQSQSQLRPFVLMCLVINSLSFHLVMAKMPLFVLVIIWIHDFTANTCTKAAPPYCLWRDESIPTLDGSGPSSSIQPPPSLHLFHPPFPFSYPTGLGSAHACEAAWEWLFVWSRGLGRLEWAESCMSL